jgi:hypothetical protein
VEQYLDLVAHSRGGTLPVGPFERGFLSAFKDETVRLPDDVFTILDTLFADVDAFVLGPDQRLPGELDEGEFRGRELGVT